MVRCDVGRGGFAMMPAPVIAAGGGLLIGAIVVVGGGLAIYAIWYLFIKK
jgi:hypothetical protein